MSWTFINLVGMALAAAALAYSARVQRDQYRDARDWIAAAIVVLIWPLTLAVVVVALIVRAGDRIRRRRNGR